MMLIACFDKGRAWVKRRLHRHSTHDNTMSLSLCVNLCLIRFSSLTKLAARVAHQGHPAFLVISPCPQVSKCAFGPQMLKEHLSLTYYQKNALAPAA